MAFSANGDSFDGSMILGYIIYIIPIFALSTIGYDEFDNGNAFLFTLPISRKEYVYEKYGFGLLLGVMAMAVAVFLSVVIAGIKKAPVSGTLMAAPFIFEIMVVLLAVMMPIQLKFGAEKGRVAMIVVVGSIAALIFGIVKLLKINNSDVLPLFAKLSNFNYGTIVAVTTVIAAAVFLLSMKISVAVMNKKEF